MSLHLLRTSRIVGALALALLLAGAFQFDAAADSSTPVAVATDPGALGVSVFTCSDTNADPEIAAAAPDCPAGGTASLWIDGTGPTDAQDGGSLPLDAGDHVVSATETGTGAAVTIVSGETTPIIVVLHVAPVEIPTTTLKIVVHRCQDKIKTLDDLNALGDFPTKLGRCPAADGAYDLTLTDSVQTFTLSDAKADGSGVRFKNVAKGPVTIVETAAPDGAVFGTAALDPASGSEAVQSDPTNATATLDLTQLDDATLHIFDFPAPATNRISIVTHLCASITAKADFQALPNFSKQLLACPVTTLPDDAGPSGLFHADPIAFDYAVKDANAATTTLAAATFKPEDFCETDFQEDLNNDGQISTNLCIDGSRYQFDGVAQGAGVVVTQNASPDGYRLGAVVIAPGDPGKVGKIDLKKQTIALDTTDVGDLTIHVFDFALPPPVQYGSVQIVTFACTGTADQTVVKALAPGAIATESDLGGPDCVAAAADFRISLFGGDPGQAFNVGDTGTTTISDLPTTSASSGLHVVTEVSSNAYAAFEIAPDQITRVIFLNYSAVDAGNASGAVTGDDGGAVAGDDGGAVGGGGDDGTLDESGGATEDVVDGADLPATGIGPAGGRDGTEVAVLFGVLSGALLIAAGLMRRRSI
jgi:hypothetical protein